MCKQPAPTNIPTKWHVFSAKLMPLGSKRFTGLQMRVIYIRKRPSQKPLCLMPGHMT